MDAHDQVLEQWNFKKVKIGNLTYPLQDGFTTGAKPVYKRVRVTVPGRLFALFKNIKGLVEQEPKTRASPVRAPAAVDHECITPPESWPVPGDIQRRRFSPRDKPAKAPPAVAAWMRKVDWAPRAEG